MTPAASLIKTMRLSQAVYNVHTIFSHIHVDTQVKQICMIMIARPQNHFNTYVMYIDFEIKSSVCFKPYLLDVVDEQLKQLMILSVLMNCSSNSRACLNCRRCVVAYSCDMTQLLHP